MNSLGPGTNFKETVWGWVRWVSRQKCFLHHSDKLSSVPGSPRRRKEPAVPNWPLIYTSLQLQTHIHTYSHTHIINTNTHIHIHTSYTPTHTYTNTHTYTCTHIIYTNTLTCLVNYSHILWSTCICLWENYNWALTSKLSSNVYLSKSGTGLGNMTSSPQELLVKLTASDQALPETSDVCCSSPPCRNPGQQSCVGRKKQVKRWQWWTCVGCSVVLKGGRKERLSKGKISLNVSENHLRSLRCLWLPEVFKTLVIISTQHFVKDGFLVKCVLLCFRSSGPNRATVCRPHRVLGWLWEPHDRGVPQLSSLPPLHFADTVG